MSTGWRADTKRQAEGQACPLHRFERLLCKKCIKKEPDLAKKKVEIFFLA
jgi:hypothetical protein